MDGFLLLLVGEVSEDGGDVDEDDDDSSGEEFNDGYDDNLMGDEEDQRTLSSMTEKEREQEIYKRLEARDHLRHRFQLERKLRKKNKLEARKAAKK
jgi:RNA polymerase-associated protein RTF1